MITLENLVNELNESIPELTWYKDPIYPRQIKESGSCYNFVIYEPPVLFGSYTLHYDYKDIGVSIRIREFCRDKDTLITKIKRKLT